MVWSDCVSWFARLMLIAATLSVMAPGARSADRDADARFISNPPIAEPEGYRMDRYRAPVPETVPGASTVGTAALKVMVDAGAVVLIDVLPAPRKPKTMKPGRVWLPKPRYGIPGSIWLPGVGFGRLSDAYDAYFRANLATAIGGDRSRKVVFYCKAHCWMSWNAAKRAVGYGYRAVIWYPFGTDGWIAAGHPVEPEQPVAMAE